MKNYSTWGAASKMIPKSLGSVFSLGCHAGIDASLVKAPLYPTYQLWPVSSAKEIHPQIPIGDPQNEFPGTSFSGKMKLKGWATVSQSGFLFRRCTHTIENKIEQNSQNTKVASAEVAFDTVRKLPIAGCLS